VAAPEFVPVSPTDHPRVYGSPPRLADPWVAARPGELVGEAQPAGPMLGTQGPDLGYALKLATTVRDRLVLTEGEHADDAVAGCTAVAMKRASLFGRAPVIHDLTMAFTLWGFLDEAPAELVAFRKPLFAEVASHHHWAERRRIVDLVPDEVLHRPHTQLRVSGEGWKRLLRVDVAA
jgi:hypothetical protein